jgi:hypothetical protein
VGIECRAGLIESLGEDRRCGVELLAHAGSLGTLAGEEVGKAAGLRLGLEDACARLAATQLAKVLQQLLAVRAEHDRPLLEERSGGE